MSELSELKSATTLPQLARLLKLKGETVSYALYWYRRANPYDYFEIPKKNGGRRLIAAPNSRLKLVQTRLAGLLGRIEAELEGKRTTKARVVSHGFKTGFSIVTNAAHHRNRRWVFNADLQDFFPRINFGRVYGFFIKDRNFQLDPKIATIIAQIACHNNMLPQGSPCSPVISNLITHILDIQLNKMASKHHCTYTRYADDLTFSTNEKEFPEAVARLVRGSRDKWTAGDGILRLVYRAGFTVNHEKSRMQKRDSRQDTTGLIVNQKLNVRHEYYKQSRAMCRHLFQHGWAHTGTKRGERPISNDSLDGMLSFIYQIRRIKNDAFFTDDQPGFSKLFGYFLDYQSFYGIVRPRIICEGKTDNIYLRAAMKSLHLKFPRLVDATPKFSLLVDFFHYNSRTARFQDLSGGGDEMNKLLSSYRQRMKPFKHGASQPVIMVVDNDSGSTKIFNHLTNILGKPIDGSDPFYYVYENLYVVPVPKVAGASTAIEDLFDSSVLAEKIGVREFNRSNKKFDQTKFYGKNEFATEIIAPKRASIDFSRFEPLLKACCDVIDHYQVLLKAAPIPTPVQLAALP
ncbi:MAG: retron Ec67 family RNA-directed DNA polymerase/endonuclease [Mesorhizobium sp.]|uniref:retron Ec67 family RNA-directed DNA polymerase/endonuclease n=1 Tax=Mesorhizobium sp. TaxID=1871066 RepID=UPI001AD56C0D|nr:retron Ec67 family RNA-directed DNA polymerase/endonuclease [Mesorhizobium sp.]MBN9219298.1 retron Ec67 family RNA-directed DNA polymerase/endonuclease [Mesorhizobium sp.]